MCKHMTIGRSYPVRATTHPSDLLRMAEPQKKKAARGAFLRDLSLAAEFLQNSPAGVKPDGILRRQAT